MYNVNILQNENSEEQEYAQRDEAEVQERFLHFLAISLSKVFKIIFIVDLVSRLKS